MNLLFFSLKQYINHKLDEVFDTHDQVIFLRFLGFLGSWTKIFVQKSFSILQKAISGSCTLIFFSPFLYFDLSFLRRIEEVVLFPQILY